MKGLKRNILQEVFDEMKPVLEEAFEELREALVIPATHDVDKELERIEKKVRENLRREN